VKRSALAPRFLWRYWWWTMAKENLFELTPLEQELFKDFVHLAS